MKKNMLIKNKTIPFTDLYGQYQEAKKSIDTAISNVLNSSSFITGPLVEKFEEEMINYTGAEACASIGSGTNALICALKSVINSGDEVITTAHTFVATTEAICVAGGIPVFVDIGDYYCLNIKEIESAITKKTRAILFVDLYGQTPEIDELKVLAKKYNLYLIEDAAQSFGSSYKNKPVGSLVDLTCFSFNPVKNLGAVGDAGMVTGRKDLITRVKMYRDHGRISRYEYQEVGYNMRIDNLQAMVVLAKLPFLENWIKIKRDICHRYNKELKNIVEIPIENQNSFHTYYVYVIKTSKRDALQEFLKTKGIETNIHYATPTHTQPAYKNYYKKLIKTEKTCNSILSLPCYHTLSFENQSYIIQSIKEFYNEN